MLAPVYALQISNGPADKLKNLPRNFVVNEDRLGSTVMFTMPVSSGSLEHTRRVSVRISFLTNVDPVCSPMTAKSQDQQHACGATSTRTVQHAANKALPNVVADVAQRLHIKGIERTALQELAVLSYDVRTRSWNNVCTSGPLCSSACICGDSNQRDIGS